MSKKLTEKQEMFLDALFTPVIEGGAGGNISVAKKIAGYASGTSSSGLVESLKEEIYERTQLFFAGSSVTAAFKISDLLEKSSEPGAKVALDAAKDLLDRAGHVKTEKVNVDLGGGVILLPEKESNDS